MPVWPAARERETEVLYMFQLGRKQTLIVVKELDFGIYLAEQSDAGMDDRVRKTGLLQRPTRLKL